MTKNRYGQLTQKMFIMKLSNMKLANIINLKSIYLLTSLHCIFLIIFCGRQWYSDTASYIVAWDVISKFEIDMWRTPVYPIFLGILKTILGNDDYLFYGTIIQHFIFLISIYYFHQLSKGIIKSYNISICTTAFYALYPCVSTWNCYMITEPLAIYGTIFMLYCALKAFQNNSIIHIIFYAFWTVFLIFLRPALIYILPVFFIGWILIYFKNQRMTKAVWGGFCTILLSSTMMLLYCQCYYNKFNLFSPSGIGVINKYYIARLNGYLKPENTKNAELKIFLENTINIHGQKYSGGTDHDLYMETEEAIYTYGLKEISNLVSTANKTDYHSFLRGFSQRVHKASNDKLFETLLHKWKNITDIFGVKLKIVYWLLIIFPIIILYWIYKKKSIPCFSIILYMLGWSHLFLILFACQNVWDRLILPIIPVYLIMFGQLFNTVKLKYNNEFEYI